MSKNKRKKLTKRQRFLVRSKAAKKGWVTRRKRLLSIAQLDDQFQRLVQEEAELRARVAALKAEETQILERMRTEVSPGEMSFRLIDQWLATKPDAFKREELLRSILNGFDYMKLQTAAVGLAETFGLSTREIYTLWHSPEYPVDMTA